METRLHSRDISDGSHITAAWGHMDSSLNTVSNSLARSIRSLLQALFFQRNRTRCATHGLDIQLAVPDSRGQVCVLAYLLVKLLKNVLSPELHKRCKDWSRSGAGYARYPGPGLCLRLFFCTDAGNDCLRSTRGHVLVCVCLLAKTMELFFFLNGTKEDMPRWVQMSIGQCACWQRQWNFPFLKNGNKEDM